MTYWAVKPINKSILEWIMEHSEVVYKLIFNCHGFKSIYTDLIVAVTGIYRIYVDTKL